MEHSTPSRPGRGWRIVMLVVVLSLLGSVPAIAAGKGKGQDRNTYAGSCWVDGNMVHGTNLPAGEMTNFWITDPDGSQHGFALGTSTWWDIRVPEREGPTTYQFIGVQKGKDGKKYDVFATCSVD